MTRAIHERLRRLESASGIAGGIRYDVSRYPEGTGGDENAPWPTEAEWERDCRALQDPIK